MHRKLLLLFFILLCNCERSLADSYIYDEDCAGAYRSYMALHLSEGHEAVLKAQLHNPNNLMATYVADYEDCLLLLMNGDEQEYEKRKDHFDERLAILDKGDEHSPWYRICKAGVYLHWALVYMRIGENLKAALAFRKSYLLVEENEKKFPGFEYNKMFIGLQQSLVGTIPGSYKWIASLFGLKVDVKKGINTLSGFVNTHTAKDPLYDEALLYNLYLRYYLFSKQEEVGRFINSDQFATQDNLLRAFVKANLSISFRKAEVALQALQLAEHDKDYSLYPAFDFEMGSALFLKSDPACIGYFQRFLKAYKGGRFVKDSWQQMSLMWYLQGNMKQATYCRLQITKEGGEQVDADKLAEKFGEGSQWPNPSLLQARLLIDGGYWEPALKKLSSINVQALRLPAEKIEYYFRLGRAYDEKGDNSKALYYYQYTITTGHDRKEYFAARAALQMGYLYERNGNAKDAITRYKEALGMRDHDFQSSIDQQAKAGINRLSAP